MIAIGLSHFRQSDRPEADANEPFNLVLSTEKIYHTILTACSSKGCGKPWFDDGLGARRRIVNDQPQNASGMENKFMAIDVAWS
jgi:hypothetical protein